MIFFYIKLNHHYIQLNNYYICFLKKLQLDVNLFLVLNSYVELFDQKYKLLFIPD